MIGPRLTRRGLMQAGAAGAAGAALLPTTGCALEARGDSGDMNILLLIIDSLRPDYVGCYGAPRVQTPNIDALAARGLRFNRAFPEAMVTVPARRSIFTGKRIFPFRNWVLHPGLGRSPGWAPIEDLDTTFTSVLRRQGYFTAQVSDNPHISFNPYYEDFRLSFDRYISVPGTSGNVEGAQPVSMEETLRWLPEGLRDERFIPGMRAYLSNNGKAEVEEQTSPARVYRTAQNVLNEAAGRQPFAMVVDCFDPHEPWSPTKEYIDLYGDPDYEGPEVGAVKYERDNYLSKDELRRARAIYAATVTMVDRWLGEFMDRFYEMGLEENTSIVLLSDHGILLGDRGWTGKIPAELHPEMAQVPFVIVHPDDKAAGAVSSYFASTHDVGPTLLSMAGADVPGFMEGTDLSTLLDGKAPAEERSFHYGGYFNRFFARTDRWALFGDNSGGSRELYDLTLDRYERKNVAERHPRLAEQLYRQVLEEAGGRLPLYLLPSRDVEITEPTPVPIAPPGARIVRGEVAQ